MTKICQSQQGDHALAHQADVIRERLTSALCAVNEIANPPVHRTPSQVSEREVRAILKLRRNRDRHFEAALFADPAWDILLELYAAELGQQRLSVSSVCLGAGVPATTALRWIGILENKGLIQRRADRLDGRRVFLLLTCAGIEAMDSFFRTVPSGMQPI